ncbi:MAG: SagB family peptide dehydrogenase [Phycisphaerae bacterium]|nr:SagB family peptide dehydrogenase [Phycisphaerae bacterium]
MKKAVTIFAISFCCLVFLFSNNACAAPAIETIKFPEPKLNGSFSIEQVIAARRSIREFTEEQLKINQLGQLCFAADGITDKEKNLRSAPSAGAIYPMRIDVVLPDGLYSYDPDNHSLTKELGMDIRPMLYIASFRQQVVQKAPCIFIISGSARRIEVKYRGKGERFILLEAGHIAQNIHLQAIAEGLGSVPVGGFDSKSVARICKFAEEFEPLYLICLGTPIEKPSLAPAIPANPLPAPPVAQPVDIRTKKIVIIIPPLRFNDMGFFGVQEACQISGVQSDIASSIKGEIKSQERNTVSATKLIKDINVDDYDAFVFVGGPGVRDYFKDRSVLRLVQLANKKEKILAAIYNAPGIFAAADVVRGKTVASFVSERRNLVSAGADWKNSDLEISDNIITANNPEAARRFGAAILNTLRMRAK